MTDRKPVKKKESDMLVAYLIRYHKTTGRSLPITEQHADRFLVAVNKIGFYGSFRYGPMSKVATTRQRCRK